MPKVARRSSSRSSLEGDRPPAWTRLRMSFALRTFWAKARHHCTQFSVSMGRSTTPGTVTPHWAHRAPNWFFRSLRM